MLKEAKKKIEILKIKSPVLRDVTVRKKLKAQRFKIIGKVPGMKGYCMACHVARQMVEAYQVNLIDSRRAIVGHCEKCGTQIYKKER